MKFVATIFSPIFYFVKKLNKVAQQNKHQHRLYAYYAFPALMGLFITFVLLRTLIKLFPGTELTVNGTHIHHFTTGIFILLGSGYTALWVQSSKLKYITALAYGVGTAFILDEFYVWLRLDPSVISHSYYDVVIIAISILLMIILLPAGIHGIAKLFNKNGQSRNENI